MTVISPWTVESLTRFVWRASRDFLLQSERSRIVRVYLVWQSHVAVTKTQMRRA